ncbi:hypothetical protein MTsPCn5_28170 [Croceitalea sp. MTPC5]|nr:hypothetical protein MTsPCn5_28170 [Croceitalea sp. MTPC5]
MAIGLAILTLSCEQQKKEHQPEPTPEVEKVVKAPEGIISLADADSLYVDYSDRRANNIAKIESQNQDDGKPFVPTRFVSFDIDSLKQYIAYVEHEAKKGGAKTDSLRIYFGNYGKRNKKYLRRNTVFIVPAAEVNGDYGGIFIAADGKAQLIRDWIKKYQNNGQQDEQKSKAALLPNFSPTPNFYNGGSLILNYGSGGPPPKTDF